MSNISNFLKYKENCFACGKELNFHFLSKNNTTATHLNNDLVTVLQINNFPSPKDKRKFSIELHVNSETNEFWADFVDDMMNPLISVPYVRLSDAQHYLNGERGLRFYKDCGTCHKYNYSSDLIMFNFKTGLIDDFDVQTESCIIYKETSDGILKRYKLSNNYKSQKSSLLYDTQHGNISNSSMKLPLGEPKDNLLELPIIRIDAGLSDRLDTIITFS